jgi:UDP-4-amino-4,6-dideoxy-N-acetyl-beta-L-altrosamine transaminase
MVTRHLPYTRHYIEPDDIDAVVRVLQGELIAQGEQVSAFENALASQMGAGEVIACSSGTAALHLALATFGVGPGDVCIVPSITFVATATAARLCGAEVVFADVDPHSGLLTPETLREAISRAARPVRVVLPVHLGGRLCDMPSIKAVADEIGALIVEDCCHALGSAYEAGGGVGGCLYSDASIFSFHPAKTITCGEGGAVALNSAKMGARTRMLRNHGCTRDADLFLDQALSRDSSGEKNPWSYEQQMLGFNYRMTDMEGALGLNQLSKLGEFTRARRSIAKIYDSMLVSLSPAIRAVPGQSEERFALHLYSINVDWEEVGVSRARFMRKMLEFGVGTQVHYIPVHRQFYFRQRYGEMNLAGAEFYYERTLSLPLFYGMKNDEVQHVISGMRSILLG